jgi:hypothetical protein
MHARIQQWRVLITKRHPNFSATGDLRNILGSILIKIYYELQQIQYLSSMDGPPHRASRLSPLRSTNW